MKPKTRVTLDDIAVKAKCSKAVVSRALRDKYGVKPETRSRIQVIALEMGYDFKNIYKRGKQSNKNKVDHICVVITRTDYMNDDFYGKIIYGIENSLSNLHIEFYLSILENINQQELVMNLQRIKAKGAIIIGLISYRSVAAILSSGMPVVLVDTLHTGLKVDRLSANNYMGAHEATEYLIENGHRNLAFIGNASFSSNFSDRYRGFKESIRRHSDLLIRDFSIIEGQDKSDVLMNLSHVQQMLLEAPKPLAVLCANDRIAFQLYELADQLHLAIPDDVSLIGFDDVEKGEWVTPKLTSVHIPKFELGQEAVRMLMQRIEQKSSVTQVLQLDTTLTKRASVKNVT